MIVLDEQMRQQQDIKYYQLLKCVRNGTVNQADVDLLNNRVMMQLKSHLNQLNPCIVQTNKLRHAINHLQIERYAQSQGQKIFVFPACHTQ